jgi:hypothetical protein
MVDHKADGGYWMFKIDSAGNKLWDKRFGGSNEDIASNFVLMPDSSIFLVAIPIRGYLP